MCRPVQAGDMITGAETILPDTGPHTPPRKPNEHPDEKKDDGRPDTQPDEHNPAETLDTPWDQDDDDLLPISQENGTS
eukprot:11107555-Heterocapsa_arctica.AAC.1